MGRYEFKYPDASEPGLPYDEPTVPSALGNTIILFEELDEQLSTAISFLLKRGDKIGRIVTAELSFRAKVNLFVALFKELRPQSKELAEMHELAAGCLQIEEKRNQAVHSKWRNQLEGPGMTRVKYTARGKLGLQQQAEILTPVQLTAIWAHCGELAHFIDELMYIEFGREYGEP